MRNLNPAETDEVIGEIPRRTVEDVEPRLISQGWRGATTRPERGRVWARGASRANAPTRSPALTGEGKGSQKQRRMRKEFAVGVFAGEGFPAGKTLPSRRRQFNIQSANRWGRRTIAPGILLGDPGGSRSRRSPAAMRYSSSPRVDACDPGLCLRRFSRAGFLMVLTCSSVGP